MNRRDALKAALATVAGIATGAAAQPIPATSHGCSSKFTCGRITYWITYEPNYDADGHLTGERLIGCAEVPADPTPDERKLLRMLTSPCFRPGWRTTAHVVSSLVGGKIGWFQAREQVWRIA
jgi:hypothetical protein